MLGNLDKILGVLLTIFLMAKVYKFLENKTYLISLIIGNG
jgi:hypothetical protein